MPFRLKSHLKAPPGSFRYKQTDGIEHDFGASPLIAELAANVAAFRSANSLPRPSYAECLEDVDAYNCARLGNMPKWCYDTDRPFSEIAKVSKWSGCGACGARV